MKKADYQFYQNLVEVLIPDVLRPIPADLTLDIRNFGRNLENWLLSAMNGCPEDIVVVKVLNVPLGSSNSRAMIRADSYAFPLLFCRAQIAAVSAFSQILRRYTSLNHLAQAARSVLQNAAQISQMLADLNRVDFHIVEDHVWSPLTLFFLSFLLLMRGLSNPRLHGYAVAIRI